ncbi:MAG: ArnT family glycosyltransferase [Anaerolineae bacterium]
MERTTLLGLNQGPGPSVTRFPPTSTVRRQAFRILSLLAIAAAIVGLALLVTNFSKTKQNHLLLAIDGEPPGPITWLWLDAVTLNRGGIPAIIGGYLWNESPGERRFEVTSDGAIEIWLNDELVYSHLPHGEVKSEAFTAVLPSGAIPLKVNYQTATPPTPRYEVSVKEGRRLIAPWRLYPTEPTPEMIVQQRLAWYGLYAGLGLVTAGSLLGAGLFLASLQRPLQEWLAVTGVVLLAIAVRLAVVVERYQVAPDFYAMQPVWDNVVEWSRLVLTGQLALPGSYHQQGALVYSALTQVALGPGIFPQYVLNALLGGLSCGLILGTAWALFGRTTGLLAGILMAFYAPLIHYQTTLQIVVPATLTIATAVALGTWLLRHPDWKPAVGYGVAVGLGILIRGTLMGLVVGGPLAIALSPVRLSLPRRLLLSALVVLSTVLTLLPMTLANIRVGVYSVSSNGFPIAFFRGNHRDTSGINEYMTDREHLARLRSGGEENFTDEALRDIQADPHHWAQLMLHKVGLFWTGNEHADEQINFYTSGLEYSAVLRLLWLGGAYSLTTLAGLAGMGALLAGLQPRYRPASLYLASVPLLIMLLTIFFSVIGRIRTPSHPALFPLAAIGIITIIDRLRGPTQSAPLVVPVAAVVVAVGLLLVNHMEHNLPGPTIVPRSRLPKNLVETNVEFESKVRLIGFDAFDSNFRPGGYLDVTLYWEALQPLDTDYTAFVHLVNLSFQRLGGTDRLLGGANFPVYLSSHWRPGEIVRQSYLVPFPDIEDQAVPMRVLAGIYGERLERLPITASLVETLGGNAAVITGVSIMPEPLAPLSEPARPLNLTFGRDIAVTGTDLPEHFELDPTSASLAVSLDWATESHPVHRYHLFLHFLDSGGNLVSQFDGPPIPEFPTDTWPPGSRWRGNYSIELPPELGPGDYQLVTGMYHINNLERLPVKSVDEPVLADNRVLLSTLRVTP